MPKVWKECLLPAAESDFKTFREGLPPNTKRSEARELFDVLRGAMQVKEGWNIWEIAPKFDWKNLRENYITQRVYKVNQLVENLNTGLIGKIIRRGANHLICVTEDKIMFKSWIKDVSEAIVFTILSPTPEILIKSPARSSD